MSDALDRMNLLAKQRTITFHCEHCGHCITVSEDMAGRRGLCPLCKGAMTVPQRASDSVDRSENPVLQSAYEDVFGLSNRLIVSGKMLGSSACFEFVTGDRGHRNQVALLSALDDGTLVAFSIVGSICEKEHAMMALHLASEHPSVNVSINEDSVLSVRRILSTEDMAPQALVKHLLEVARLADAMEERIFGWDRA